MTLRLTVKGNAEAAIAAALSHGVKGFSIEMEKLRLDPRFDETILHVPGQYRAQVVSWFADGGDQTPFPPGALLFYNEAAH